MGKIVKWLMGCGYGKSEATTEANKMIEANRLDGAENIHCVVAEIQARHFSDGLLTFNHSL